MGSAVNFRASSRRDAIAELAAGRDQFSEIGVWEPATATGEVRSDLIDLRDDIDCQGGTQASAE
jgi:hypothetical protein